MLNNPSQLYKINLLYNSEQGRGRQGNSTVLLELGKDRLRGEMPLFFNPCFFWQGGMFLGKC